MQDAAPRAILLLHARTIANEHILHAQLFSMSILHSAWENGKPEPYGQCGLYFGIRSKSACPRRIGWYKGFGPFYPAVARRAESGCPQTDAGGS